MYSSKNVNDLIKVSSDIWRKGWAEGNGGNISIRMTSGSLEEFLNYPPKSDWIPIGASYPDLSSETILVSGTGRFLRNIEINPERNVGIITLDEKGENYRIIWGFEGSARPTSELRAHLGILQIRKMISNNTDRSVIHTHTPHLIALTYMHELDQKRISRLIWEMHTECIVVFPEGVGFVKWMMPGSIEIANATAEEFRHHRIVIWEQHGVLATGRNLDMAFGLIDTAEKVAKIYIKAVSTGCTPRKLKKEVLLSLAENFKVSPNLSYLEE